MMTKPWKIDIAKVERLGFSKDHPNGQIIDHGRKDLLVQAH
jgi:hypothetical protein